MVVGECLKTKKSLNSHGVGRCAGYCVETENHLSIDYLYVRWFDFYSVFFQTLLTILVGIFEGEGKKLKKGEVSYRVT